MSKGDGGEGLSKTSMGGWRRREEERMRVTLSCRRGKLSEGPSPLKAQKGGV